MARDGLRQRMRRHLSVAARRVRDALVPDQDDAPGVAEPTLAPAPPAPADDTLLPEDISLDAFYVLDRIGVGWEVCVVDVREAAELAGGGRVDGALHIPLGELTRRRAEIPDDVTTLVVCASGVRSVRAALALRQGGHPDAWSLLGGVPAWQRQGGPMAPT